MKPRVLVGEALSPGGERLTLHCHDGCYEVRVGGELLMSSGEHHSEEQMAEHLCDHEAVPPAALRVLVAGLGVGYTLRAALDRLGPASEIVVVELMPAVVEWNRGPLAHLAGRPLEDPRVQLEVMDLAAYLRTEPEPFDVVLMDIDNGPEAFTIDRNGHFYGRRGLLRLRRILRPGGKLVVWSAFEARTFPGSLRNAGFTTDIVRTRSRGDRGAHHTLYVARLS